MLYNASNENEVEDLIHADIVIVGAGTVGLFIAHCLTLFDKSKKITIVESGDNIPSTASNDLSGKSVGKLHGGVSLGRAQGLGGTSSLWGGQLAEFDKLDLARSEDQWPVAYEELTALYSEVYKYLDVKVRTQDYYRKKFGGETSSLHGVERFFTHWLKEPNFARLFKKLILSSGIDVLTNLTVVGIKFDSGIAKSISCKSKNGRIINLFANKLIIAAGTIPSNRLFLSTQLAGNVPWSRNLNVGRYFQDHLGGQIAKVKITDEVRFREYFENCFIESFKLQPKFKFSENERQSSEVGVCAFFSFDSRMSESFSNIKLLIKSFRSNLLFSKKASLSILRDITIVGRSLLPIASRYIKNRRVFALMDRGVFLRIQSEQIPIHTSCITLASNQVAQDGLFPVAVNWDVDGRELEDIRKMAKKIDLYLKERQIGYLEIDKDLFLENSVFLELLSDTYHQCGGLRMSKSELDGVVDQNCCVWGAKNVWVAGSAVFPSSSHANCTLTALALSLKIVNSILKE